MKITSLSKYLSGQANFRIKQAEKLIFQDLITNWDQASVFPLSLRSKLNKNFPLTIDVKIFKSKDGKSAKSLIFLEDGLAMETALMSHRDGRNTVCLSSQIGCPLSCSFCASGKSFKRNLSLDEILLGALFWARYLKENKMGRFSNVVFMGSGEPFLNDDNVFRAIYFLNNPNFFNISARKISISTIGISSGIRRMAREDLAVNLSISLHFVDEKKRIKMMPATQKYPLSKMFEAVNYYIEKTNRKTMFEYILIKGLNDSPRDAEKLAILMKKPLYMVNLIKCNRVGKWEAPDNQKISRFKNILLRKGIELTERHRFNEDVEGACGQFSGIDNKKSI
jgi:23S rRNA (adenine2503-C2)-methyltransferase